MKSQFMAHFLCFSFTGERKQGWQHTVCLFVCLFLQHSIETTYRVYKPNPILSLKFFGIAVRSECIGFHFLPLRRTGWFLFGENESIWAFMRRSRCTWTIFSCRYRQMFVFSDWSLITFIMNSLNQQYEEKVRPCIDLIDSLRSLGVEKDLALPAIAVIGDQSSGKSSVLEALSGVALPRGSGRNSQEI